MSIRWHTFSKKSLDISGFAGGGNAVEQFRLSQHTDPEKAYADTHTM
jgi:hypothetical protein